MKKVKRLKGEKVKGEGNPNIKATVLKTHRALAKARKTYTLGMYAKPGFTCEGVGPDVWSDAYKMSLQSFGNRKSSYVLIVSVPMWKENGRRAKPLMKFGAFCRIKEVIAAIEKEEGGER